LKEIKLEQLTGAGATYFIVGHSERRADRNKG
jgi:triosephosphate isomerase